MVKTPQRFYLPAINGDQVDVFCNWNPLVKGKYIKFVLNDEQSFIVPRSSFSKIAMWLASEEEQERIIPTTSIPVRHFEKWVVLKMKKTIREGETLRVKVDFDVPLTGSGIKGEIPVILPFKN